MKVAKITLWDGRVFYTDRFDRAFLAQFFERAKDGVELSDGATSQVDIIEMGEREYMAIPGTVESWRLFGTKDAPATTNTQTGTVLKPSQSSEQDDAGRPRNPEHR